MTEDLLKEIVCSVGRMDRGAITSSTSLGGLLGGSLGRARLDAAVRSKLGISSPAVYRAATFGDLCAAIGVSASGSGNGSSTNVAAPVRVASSLISGIRIGVDVESISALPAVTDFWEDEFYRGTFARSEIAYALMQKDPRATFAAIWCAKEALRKADPALADIDWQRIVVIHDADGRPEFHVDGLPTGGALSLSHTEEIAFAAFVEAQMSQIPPSPVVDPPVGAPVSASMPARTGALSLAIALLALAVSIASVVFLFFRR